MELREDDGAHIVYLSRAQALRLTGMGSRVHAVVSAWLTMH